MSWPIPACQARGSSITGNLSWLQYHRHFRLQSLWSRFTPISMYSPACRRALRPSTICTATQSASEFTLPGFLVPAFTQRWQQRANFSATRSEKSKIGSAPLTLPPDVTFNIIQTPAVAQGRGMSRTQPGAVVEIQGPLGKMSYPIPAYMTIQHDEAAKTHTLSILDQKERKQREMWGAYCQEMSA